MIKRRPDWPEKLAAFIETRRERVFSWGEQDCALLAADAVLEMTGVDLASGLRGYKSARGAAARMKVRTWGSPQTGSSVLNRHS